MANLLEGGTQEKGRNLFDPVEVPEGDLGWTDVAKYAGQNIPSSGVQFGKDIAQPFIHPIETGEAISNLGQGLFQKMVPGVQGKEVYADAVGEFIANRYGGMDEFKRTLASDPVGVLADFATILTAGGGAAVRVPGVVGKLGKVAQTVGKNIDPLSVVAKAEPLVSNVLGQTTGAGAEAVRGAGRAGVEGGTAGRSFRENMRGGIPPETVVDEARAAVTKMRQDRGEAYRTGMAGVTADMTPLKFGPIDDAIREVSDIGVFKGKVLNKSAEDTWQKIAATVDEWRTSPAAEFHTAEGLDALKKAIGDIRDTTEFRSPSRVIADQVYNAVKTQIVKQAPEYANVMKEYERASDLLTEVEKALSLGNKAAADTALRKLQSVMRNNANTNYGARVEMARKLESAGAPDLMAKLSGQALSSATPRGLQSLGATGLGGAAVLSGQPQFIPLLAASSPRLVGEAAHAAGRISPALRTGPRMAAFQTGRMGRLEEELRMRGPRR